MYILAIQYAVGPIFSYLSFTVYKWYNSTYLTELL